MPKPDPTRADEAERFGTALIRYKKLMTWMAMAAFIAILLALLYLKLTLETVTVHMAVATAAGVGFSVLLGTGLMGLVYLSNNSGHDDVAGSDRHE